VRAIFILVYKNMGQQNSGGIGAKTGGGLSPSALYLASPMIKADSTFITNVELLSLKS